MILSEKRLIKGCIQQCRKSQEKLYRTYAEEMYKVCLTYTKDTAVAKDVLSEAFLKVFNNIESFNGQGKLKSWIRRIVSNTAIDAYRRQKIEGDVIAFDALVEQKEIADIDIEHCEEELLAYVEQLPDGARMVFNLYAIEGYGHKEIAEKLGISEGTSKSQLNRARGILKEQLNQSVRV